ncbi:MAG: transposase [Fidelibacterota bacterium]
MSGQAISYRYSESFKQKVISEIERGRYSIAQAVKVYGVSDRSLYTWLHKYGKNHLIGKIVKVEMKGEADRIKQLENEKKELESALAQAHLKIITLESTIECAEDIYKFDLKKKSGSGALKKVLKK